MSKNSPTSRVSAERQEPPPNWRRRDGRTCLFTILIVAVVVAAFFPTLSAEFNYDDDKSIVENPHYRGLGLVQLRWMFTTFHAGHYQPLAWLTLGLDYVLWGMEPAGYHLTNLILHCANAALVYWIALAFMRRKVRSSTSAGDQLTGTVGRVGGAVHLGAAFAALFFAVHPLRVESVGWVTERRDVLSSFFLLVTVLIYLHAHRPATGTQPSATARKRSGWIVAAVVVYTLSLLSRAMGMTLPLILLVLDAYPLRRLGSGSGRSRRRNVRAVLLEKIAFLIPAVCAAIIAAMAQRDVGASISLAVHGVGARFAQAGYGLVFYLWKTLLPFNLVPMYRLEPPIDVFAPRYVICWLIVFVVTVGLFTLRPRLRAVMVGALCYTVLLLPVLGFMQSGQQEVADRYSYLPSIAWAVLLGAGLMRVWLSHRMRRIVAWAATVGGVLAIAGLSVLSWRQCLVWQTSESLWRHAVTCGAPNAVAYFNLGGSLAKLGRFDEAMEYYGQALQVDPAYPLARYNLGNACAKLGRYEEAATWYREEIAAHPGHTGAHFNLGQVLSKQGRFRQAIQSYLEVLRLDPADAAAKYSLGHAFADMGQFAQATAWYREAIQLRPDHPEAHIDLAQALYKQGILDEALKHCRTAIELDPNFAAAHQKLGDLLIETGRPDEAIEAYRKSLQLNPESAEAHVDLGVVLLKKGLVEAAIREYREALRINPDHALACYNLGISLSNQGKVDEAIQVYQKALEIDPEHVETHVNLGIALSRQGKLNKAIEEYEKALELDPDKFEGRYNLGVALLRVGKVDQAIEQLEEALRIRPDHDATRQVIAALRAQQGDSTAP